MTHFRPSRPLLTGPFDDVIDQVVACILRDEGRGPAPHVLIGPILWDYVPGDELPIWRFIAAGIDADGAFYFLPITNPQRRGGESLRRAVLDVLKKQSLITTERFSDEVAMGRRAARLWPGKTTRDFCADVEQLHAPRPRQPAVAADPLAAKPAGFGLRSSEEAVEQALAHILHVTLGGVPHLLVGPVRWHLEPGDDTGCWYFGVVGAGGGNAIHFEPPGGADRLKTERLRAGILEALTQEPPIAVLVFDDELEMLRWATLIWPASEQIRLIRVAAERERAP